MKKIIALVLTMLLCVLLNACCLNHEWQEPNCTTPKTCAKCQETEGGALGHTWVEADCETAKTCQVCGETEGEPLGHTPGEWELISLDPITLERERVKYCTVCEKMTEEENGVLTNLYEDGKFLLTCEQVMKRMEYASTLTDTKHTVTFSLVMDDNGYAMIKIEVVKKVGNGVTYSPFGKVWFEDEEGVISYHDIENCPTEFQAAGFDWPLIVLTMALDPTLTETESGAIGVLSAALRNGGETVHNGIYYTIAGNSDLRVLDVSIAQ